METEEAEHTCSFEWDIYNPFLPWQRIEATFYSGLPTLTKWKVALTPMDRRINVWKFLFSLKGERPEGAWILARQVRVYITINGRDVARENSRANYYFSISNGHTYDFEAYAVFRPGLEWPRLTIVVDIHLPGPPVLLQGGRALHYYDQKWLSNDLGQLFDDHRYSDMTLLARGGLRSFQVHSCILDARWPNIFPENFVHATSDYTVETGISEGLLSDILTYIYSGTLPAGWPNWTDTAYITELFEVIEEYKLHHLYEVFVKNDSHQLRETKRSVFISGWVFKLDYVDGQPFNNISHSFPVYASNPLLFVFEIKVFMEGDNPWLTYSFRSTTPVRVNVQVNLEFRRKIIKWRQIAFRKTRVLSVHECDYVVNPNGFVQSEQVHFKEDAPIFDHFYRHRLHPRGTKIQHSICCILYISDGTTVEEVRNTLDNSIQDDQERFNVLSEAMQSLLQRGIHSELRIECPIEPSGIPNRPGGYYEVHFVHEAIFAARVSGWRGVLGNVPKGKDMSRFVKCFLRSEAFRHVLFYIYTGKIWSFPLPFLDEVRLFAERSGFTALENLVNRMSTQRINR